MALDMLVVTRDPEALRVLRRTLQELNISAEVAASCERAQEIAAKRRFDAMAVDADDLAGGVELLRRLRQSAAHKRTLIFALVNGKTSVHQAFELGANFVLDKPLTAERAGRSLRAAHGLMMRERRRYSRNALSGPVKLVTAAGHEIRARLVNLSEGGVSVGMTERFTPNGQVRLKFTLPDTHVEIEAKAEVSWIGNSNTVGLHFLHLEQRMQRELELWVARQPEPEAARAAFMSAGSFGTGSAPKR